MHKSGLVELDAVLAVARRRSFRAAALDLDMAASAVSQAIAGLERRLGSRLFHRTTRSVALTEAGRHFVQQIQPAVRQIRQAFIDTESRHQAPSGTLRINSSLGAALMAFQPILLEYLSRYPDMHLDIVTEGRKLDIVAEGYDAGLRDSASVPQDMIRVAIDHKIPMVVVASPTYLHAHGRPLAPEQLSTHSCIRARMPDGAPSAWDFCKDGRAYRLEVPGRLTLDTPILMREAARAGMGLAQLARAHVADDLASGRLVAVLHDQVPAYPGLSLYYPGHRHVPAGLRALVELIHERRDTDDGRPAAGDKSRPASD